MINSGLNYFLDLINFDKSLYKVHYSFSTPSGLSIENIASGYSQMSGALNATGNFYTYPNTGNFDSGQYITIQNSTGLISNNWSHVFVYNKTNTGKCILFDSFLTGNPLSGYQIGINDSNRIFFESYNNNNQFTKTSNLILGKNNILGVSKADSIINYYLYDHNLDQVLTDSKVISNQYINSSSKGIIGNSINNFNFAESGAYSGQMAHYIYFSDALTPFSFRYIVSGLFTNISQTNLVTGYSVNQITGYFSGFTGVTGIVGFQNVITGSGIDPFDTGNYIEYFASSGITGFLTSGIYINPLTGLVTTFVTGDPITTLSVNSFGLSNYGLDHLAYIRKIDYNDFSRANFFKNHSNLINKVAGYDTVRNSYQLDQIYDINSVNIYANGIAYNYEGFSYTGNFYNSGINISGDYVFDNFYINWINKYFSGSDSVIYDNLSGARNFILTTGDNYSGNSLSIIATGDYIMFNGVLLESGIQYITSGGNFVWNTSYFSGVTGKVFKLPIQHRYDYASGIFINNTGFLRRNSQLYLNGARQLLDVDYFETSSISLVQNSGLFCGNFDSIFINETGYYNL